MPALAKHVKPEVAVFTARCPKCGSAEMWTEHNRFGCDSCGALFCTADGQPVRQTARRDL